MPIPFPSFVLGIRTRRCLAAWLALALTAAAAQAQSHKFTELSGNVYDGQVVGLQGDQVDLRFDNGKVFRREITNFIPADQQFLRQWAIQASRPHDALATTESDIEIKIALDKTTPAGKSGNPVYPRLKAIVTNRETLENFSGLKGTLIILGRDRGSARRYRILARETFVKNLAAGDKIEFASQPVTDDRTDFPIKGFIFVLQSSDGNIIQYRHFGPTLRNADAALQLQPGAIFDARLRPFGRGSASSLN
jgi:hypothetical protein